MHLRLCPIIPSAAGDTTVRNLWDIPSVRESWTRITSANGGYLTGSFEVSGLAESDIKDFFNRYLGFEVQEHTINTMTWNGFIYRMTLELNGVQYVRTLEPDWFHNRVKVYYSNLSVVDSEQGALAYRTVPLRFSDDAQDFSAWQTVAGNATYRIQVANTDGTTSWAYLGAASTVTNPNDTIAVYQDISLVTPGWNDQDPIGPPLLTPTAYQVFEIQFEGERYDTAWAEELDSETTFGTVEYIISLGGADAIAADALRDRHLTEFGYPRTRMSGGIEIVPGAQRRSVHLTVDVAGFVATLFWTYRGWSQTDTVSDLIIGTAYQSEFVRASTQVIGVNAMITTVDCYPMPQRIGDVIQMLVDQGDAAGNAYQWFVYNRILYYEAQPTEPTYFLSNGQLFDQAGTMVIPQRLKPGFLLRVKEAPVAPLPLGATSVAEGDVAYVEQVEFTAPNILRLTLAGQDNTAIIEGQIQSGTFAPEKSRGGTM